MKSYIFIFSLLFVAAFSQTFPYTREWATYVSGVKNTLSDEFKIISNDNNKFFFKKDIYKYPELGIPYYQQYVTESFADYTQNDLLLQAQYSLSGQLLNGYNSPYFGENEEIVAVDAESNTYYLQNFGSIAPGLSTANVWLQNPAGSTNRTYVLVKKSPGGNIIWKTYLPCPTNDLNLNNSTVSTPIVKVDNNQNVYILGRHSEAVPGLASPRAIQESHTDPLNNAPSPFLVKLNVAGKKFGVPIFQEVLGILLCIRIRFI